MLFPRFTFILLTIFILPLVLLGQEASVDEDSIYTDPDIYPTYKEGELSLFLYIENMLFLNLRQDQIDQIITNRGYASIVRFLVLKNGTIKDVKLDEFSNDFYLTSEIEFIFNRMPAWNPGMIDSMPVITKVYMHVDIENNNGNLEVAYRPVFPESVVLSNKKFKKKNTLWALVGVAAVIGLFYMLIKLK
jgi:hypothetical protein